MIFQLLDSQRFKKSYALLKNRMQLGLETLPGGLKGKVKTKGKENQGGASWLQFCN